MQAKTYTKLHKIWSRFSTNGSLGRKQFRFEKLPEDRFEEFLDFKIKFYVQNEISHTIAGIYKNPEALEEYRKILSTSYKNQSHEVTICLDEDDGDIVACSEFCLYKKGDVYEDIKKASTKVMKNYYRILHEWNNLYPVPDILTKYGCETYLDDGGIAVNPKYKGYGILKHANDVRKMQCIEYGAMLSGAWMTAIASQVVLERAGWKTVYEISSDELGKKLGVTFNNDAPPFIKYMLLKL